MQYDFIAIPDAEIPRAVEPVFQHVVTTYASEANKTANMWRAVPNDFRDFKPHEKKNPIRTILKSDLRLSSLEQRVLLPNEQGPGFLERKPALQMNCSIGDRPS